MKTMHQGGLKVLRIKGMINSVIFVLLITGIMTCAFFFEWPSQKALLIISLFLIIIVPLVLIWLLPKYRYVIFKYHYDVHNIFIQNGIFFIKQYRLPLYRVQNIEVNEGWLMRRYHLANIELSTAGGNVSIKLIHKVEAQKINLFVKQHGMMEAYDLTEETKNHKDENEAEQ